jgi:hypothetical protein
MRWKNNFNVFIAFNDYRTRAGVGSQEQAAHRVQMLIQKASMHSGYPHFLSAIQGWQR